MRSSGGRGPRGKERVRCAIYTRKSSEEGLEQEFNSLQAQREACEAFINSQHHEGWVCVRTAYDDGGFSGATMERPALQRLLADIAAGQVDTIVVYKIDRLTRSLADFAKIVEILDASGEPASVPGSFGNRSRPSGAGVVEVDRQIVELRDQSTSELRRAWRQLHRTGPPEGLSRDLLIRALAHQLQERAAGGASRALRRRLQTLAGELDKKSGSFEPGTAPKAGTTLVRQWRGHAHTVLVREDGFEYEGQHYRSLTVIAERITGAHWSGPRFFGLIKRRIALAAAEAD